MASKRDAQRMSETAKRMKEMGIRRTTGRCPICNHIVAVPMDRHFYGAVC